jgi:peptidoglycan/LPS O-acetylase OafA/YrhL
MKSKKENLITILLYIVFLIGLLVAMYIVITDIDTPNSIRFVIGFVIFLLLFGLFQMILIIMNIKKLPGIDIKRRILKFTGTFVFLMTVTYTSNYLFWPERLDNLDFGAPLGLALGITFYDLLFKKVR